MNVSRYACWSVVVVGWTAALGRSAEPIDFQRDIRPILSDNCFLCHGPDEGTRKGQLRLDRRDAAQKGGRSGEPAIVPGKPEQSALIQRITSRASDQMPPPKSGKKLTPRQIELLQRWVSSGADYRVHWAFVAPRRPQLPRVQDAAWVRNPIDAFILARLEGEGLRPSSAADRLTLLRRLHLDLIGLPPTPEEVEAFQRSADRNLQSAIDEAIERLLASPHYGERWGRFWLDAARYADSDGYEKDKPHFVWMYRDWVVSAFNRNLPYDRFLIEQLAGDLIPGAGQDQHVATGFLRNSMINEEGGVMVQPELEDRSVRVSE
jgi:hypothetical protein